MTQDRGILCIYLVGLTVLFLIMSSWRELTCDPLEGICEGCRHGSIFRSLIVRSSQQLMSLTHVQHAGHQEGGDRH